jgi:4-hydroxy-tetrahydrodipicolinate synthase
MARLVEFQIAAGVEMLFPCGTTGEGATLGDDEWERVVAIVLETANGRVPVVPGAGSNSTARAVRLTRRAAELGAHGVLSVGPFYNKPEQEGYFQHFRAIAEAADIPVVLYNVPGRTAGNIRAETTLRLAEDVPGIVGIKEASGDLDQVGQILRHRPSDFRVLSGDDHLAVTQVLMGADGVVSVTANEVPGAFSTMIRSALAGDSARAGGECERLMPLMKANFVETNPGPVKAALAMLGLIEESYRLPMVRTREETRASLREILTRLGLLECRS